MFRCRCLNRNLCGARWGRGVESVCLRAEGRICSAAGCCGFALRRQLVVRIGVFRTRVKTARLVYSLSNAGGKARSIGTGYGLDEPFVIYIVLDFYLSYSMCL